MGSTCTLLDSNLDPQLQQNYEKLKSQLEQVTSELESIKKIRANLDAELSQIHAQKANSDNVSLKDNCLFILSLIRRHASLGRNIDIIKVQLRLYQL